MSLRYPRQKIGHSDCLRLLEITILKGVIEIGNGAFFCCDITEIEIPEDVTKIGVAAFMNCKRISNVTIPSSVTKIGDYAFYGCESMAKTNIPVNVKEIGEHAFDDHCIQMKMQMQFNVDRTCYNIIAIQTDSLRFDYRPIFLYQIHRIY